MMLLLNRRGFSTHVHCPACGHVEIVPVLRPGPDAITANAKSCCAITAAIEQEPPQAVARSAARRQVRYQGLGTEKLQAEIEEQVSRTTSCAAWTATRCSSPAATARARRLSRRG